MAAAGDKNKKTDARLRHELAGILHKNKAHEWSWDTYYTLYIIIYSVYNNNINYDMYRRNRKLLRRIRRVKICSTNNKLAAEAS